METKERTHRSGPRYRIGDAVYFRGREYEVIAINQLNQTTTYVIQDIYDSNQTTASEPDLLAEEPED